MDDLTRECLELARKKCVGDYGVEHLVRFVNSSPRGS